MARTLRIYSLFCLLQLPVLYVKTGIVSQEDTDHYAILKEVGNGTLVSEFQWVIPNMHHILEMAHSPAGETIPGPEFYTGQPGYKVRMGVTVGRINPADGSQYMGVWFTLVRGKFDDVVEWPFQYKFNVTLVDQSNSPEEDNIHLSMNPMTAICRLLKQFLRPKTRKREGDGCGKAFFVPHNRLLNEGKFILNGSALIRVTVFLEDRGAIPKRAKAYMRGHQLVSEFLWEIEDIDTKIKRAKEGFLSTITSDLFYVNSESYLMVLQLSIHPEEEHLGLFATLVPGDFDDTLEWPFAYNFELSIADQSPGYLTFDRKGLVDPNSGICSLNSFTKPQYQPNVPCGFRRLLSFHQLESRNFKKNGNLLVRFAAILDQMPNFAAVGAKDGHLVGEYTWRVPNIERKIQLGKTGKMNNLLSERFYSNHQGYLMQLQLKFQNVTTGHLGLYLTLLEGEYDSLLEWPFVKRFELTFIDQQPGGEGKDIVLSVDPRNPYITNDACVGSFWRPVSRNDACGSASTVSYETLYTRKYIRYGALLVKVTVYLEEINPPRFGTLTVEDDHVVSTYEWTLKDIDDHMARARKGEIQFIDSEKFYVTNNGYRMMLRLYPEKSYGYIGLYAVLTKGAYDKSLQWPFKYKYQLTMVDQSEKKPRLDISRITYPSTASSGCPEVAFTKPEQELAEWSCGEGRMISHETLNTRGYKKDGGVRVKITVFLKELAPQVASINFHQNAITAEYSWLVHDLIDRIELLKAKELMKIESPLFYTSNQGYAIRVSLALNTIAPPLHSLANHKEEFVVGLYVTIFKGKFDEILRWPFPHTILMTLVDQTYTGIDLVKTIDPRNSRCPPHAFDKPRDVQNENACGFAVFVSLERLQSYVKDGAVLFRTSVITGQIVR